MNKKIKNRIVFYTMLLVLFVIVNIVVSFAYLRGRSNNNESVSTIAIEGVGNIKVVYSGNTSNIVVEDILPGYETVKKFTVTSNISSGGVVYNRGIWYQIKLIVDTNEFMSESLVYSLSLDDNSSTDGITALTLNKIAIPNGANSDGILIGTGYFSSDNVSHIYNLKLNYVNMEEVDQSEDYQKKFAAHVVIDNPRYVNLTFNLDGGRFENLKLNSNSTMKVAANSTIDFPIPIKENYAFAGWEIGNVSANNNVITTNDSDISLKAIWISSAPYEFDYTGGQQQFIAEVPGYYKLETWGAQGGNSLKNGVESGIGGYGGYSSGTMLLKKDDSLYIYVGGRGANGIVNILDSTGGYNGGGLGHWDNSDDEASGGGGGATHVATITGLLSQLENNKNDLLLVSGGGGGGAWDHFGGHGGGIDGHYGWDSSTISGTQISGNAFGTGGNGGLANITNPGGGGGGGFYGGGGGQSSSFSGAGGSGYIGNSLLTDKYMYCYNCTTSDEAETKTYATTCAEETPTENCAKIGNGYARITYLHS